MIQKLKTIISKPKDVYMTRMNNHACMLYVSEHNDIEGDVFNYDGICKLESPHEHTVTRQHIISLIGNDLLSKYKSDMKNERLNILFYELTAFFYFFVAICNTNGSTLFNISIWMIFILNTACYIKYFIMNTRSINIHTKTLYSLDDEILKKCKENKFNSFIIKIYILSDKIERIKQFMLIPLLFFIFSQPLLFIPILISALLMTTIFSFIFMTIRYTQLNNINFIMCISILAVCYLIYKNRDFAGILSYEPFVLITNNWNDLRSVITTFLCVIVCYSHFKLLDNKITSFISYLIIVIEIDFFLFGMKDNFIFGLLTFTLIFIFQFVPVKLNKQDKYDNEDTLMKEYIKITKHTTVIPAKNINTIFSWYKNDRHYIEFVIKKEKSALFDISLNEHIHITSTLIPNCKKFKAVYIVNEIRKTDKYIFITLN